MDWESWEDWEAWEEGGGSGPAPTYTISGTITGDEVSGVTVALTGDATDSVVTAGDGTYSFTGLSNGSYTVTPTLANYNFTPASINVTVADGDQTGKDFVSAENTYTLSGTVSGDVVEGVTITLTGDASDSTTTDSGGDYSFTLPNGDYNVEPSLEGYTFSPTNTDVTISGADATGKDFVSTEITYAISGSIVDGADAGIEGVTVTLSGDADDSTTTDGDGAYSFTGLSDGSYTVTPTYANLKMTPASRAANVSGGNVAMDNIVGQYLLLPYTYSMSSVAPSSGGVAAQLDDWYLRSDGLADGTITTSVADTSAFTPTGVTKGFLFPWNGTRAFGAKLLENSIDPTLTSLRFSWLVFAAQNLKDCTMGLDAVLPINATTASLAFWPVGTDTYAKYDEATVSNEISPAATNLSETRWRWYRAEWNFVTGKITVSMVLAQTGASEIEIGPTSMAASGQALGHIPTGLQYAFFSSQAGGSTPTVAKFWIGTASDAWPI